MLFKRFVSLFFVILGFSASPVFAQKWANDMFSVKNYDFGQVSHGAKAEYEFEVYNPYVEDVQISSISTSCSCTSVSMQNRTIKTYETGKILAHFNTDKFYGSKSATITVVISKPYSAVIQLNVKGYIRSDLVFQPGSVDFGAIYPGEPQEKQVLLSYTGRGDWKILGATCSNPNITVQPIELQRQRGNVSYKLNVNLASGAPNGYINDRITLKTNDGQGQGIQLMVQGLVKSNIMVSPASLMMGTLEPGQEIVKQLVIRGDKPFKIKKITCQNPNFSFVFPDEANSVAKTIHVIPVKFKADTTNMQANIVETIKIETDAKQSMAELPAYVEVTPNDQELEVVSEG